MNLNINYVLDKTKRSFEQDTLDVIQNFNVFLDEDND
jgi:hypothetical protein